MLWMARMPEHFMVSNLFLSWNKWSKQSRKCHCSVNMPHRKVTLLQVQMYSLFYVCWYMPLFSITDEENYSGLHIYLEVRQSVFFVKLIHFQCNCVHSSRRYVHVIMNSCLDCISRSLQVDLAKGLVSKRKKSVQAGSQHPRQGTIDGVLSPGETKVSPDSELARR